MRTNLPARVSWEPRWCGCWHVVPNIDTPRYLPLLQLESNTSILATTSRTTLNQTFVNSTDNPIPELRYTFPLYDGVSVVGFRCTVGSKVIIGVVKEKQQARADYNAALAKGQTAGLFEQLPEASDVFTTTIGNVPASETVRVEIVYLGELKHDAETDGSKFTIPTLIAPRYGQMSTESSDTIYSTNVDANEGLGITVDIALEQGSVIRGLQSPSHPIAVTMGRTSGMDTEGFENNNASATLTLGSTSLDKDFVVIIQAKGQDTPRALLETHATIPHQRALMTTLVPKFNIPNASPEIVFVVDRSGSMNGKIDLLVKAMKVFLKSLPVGIKFNICSFGSSHSFLFSKSKTYDESSLNEALRHLETFDADFGGTEMLKPVKATVENRFRDLPLEVMLLTDGEIWNQEELFQYINGAVKQKSRFFALGIGNGASTALVEGIARAGNGFAQFVSDGEKMERGLIRMLKGALTPQITDYTLEVKYANNDPDSMDDDFEVVESFTQSTQNIVTDRTKPLTRKIISLFNPAAKEEPTNPANGRYDDCPLIEAPAVLQAPHRIPSLFAYNRTTVYLLLGANSEQKTPKSVVLRGTSEHGPLELEIPVQDVGQGQTIHQMAAKKATHELEQGRGWLTQVKVDNKSLQEKYPGRWDLMIEREVVRLGVQFQVSGKWCSFVAVDENAVEWDDASTIAETESKHESSSAPAGRRGGGVMHSLRARATGKSPSVNPFTPLSSFASSGNAASSFGSPRSTVTASQFASTPPSTAFGTAPAGASFLGSRDRCVGPSFNTSSGGDGSGFGALTPQFRYAPLNHNSGPSIVGSAAAASTHLGSSSFGAAPNEQAKSGGLSGASGATRSGTGGGLFGGSNASSGLFGNSNATQSNTGGGLFGTSNTSSEPFHSTETGSSLFGQPQRNAAPASPGGPDLQMQPAQPMPASPSSVAFMNPEPLEPSADTAALLGFSQQTQYRSSPRTYSYASAEFSAAPCPPPPAAAAAAAAAAASWTGGSAKKKRVSTARKQLASKAARKAVRAEMDCEQENEEEDGTMDMGFGFSDETSNQESEKTSARPPQSNEDKMHKLIELQKFRGSWEASPLSLAILDTTSTQLAQIKATGAEAQITVFVVAWLRKVMPADQDIWEMIAEKALTWLRSELGGSEQEVEHLVDSAKGLITV